MSPVTLERAIRAFCREAGLPRAAVTSMPIGSHIALWVKDTPCEPTPVPAVPRAPIVICGMEASYA